MLLLLLMRELGEGELVEDANVSTQKEQVSWRTHRHAMYPFPHCIWISSSLPQNAAFTSGRDRT